MTFKRKSIYIEEITMLFSDTEALRNNFYSNFYWKTLKKKENKKTSLKRVWFDNRKVATEMKVLELKAQS